MDLERLSLNQITSPSWTVAEATEGCARQGVPWIGLWRHKVKEQGMDATKEAIKGSGLRVSSLCRGGMFPADSAAERQRRIEDNRHAIADAAELGTNVLVLVTGGLNGCCLGDARRMVEDGIAAIVDNASVHGVRLAIEPLHPMFGADRSVIVTLAQANDIVERMASPSVGVAIDVFHVWWDPNLYGEIARAAGHILGFHVSDWLAPVHDALMSRGMMGDGPIELKGIRQAVTAAGYEGPVEVEIFNQKIWDTPGNDVLVLMKQRFAACV